MEKLEPCPFCGGVAEVEQVPGNFQEGKRIPWSIWCYNCNLSFGYDSDYGVDFPSKAEAITAWNQWKKNLKTSVGTFIEPEVTVVKAGDYINLANPAPATRTEG